jgi:hypothetical protein
MRKLKLNMIALLGGIFMISCGGNQEAIDALNKAAAELESSEIVEPTVTADESEADTEDIEEVVEVEVDEDAANEEAANAATNEMLDDYEAYVDEYLVLYKKAMAGDNTAMAEYPALMQKAAALQQTMGEAQAAGTWGVEQIQRMLAIQTKMANAALGS